MVLVVAERSGHPATSGVELGERQTTHLLEQLELAAQARDRFLMTMAVEHRASRDRRRDEVRGFADEKLVEQQRALRERSRARIAGHQARQFVAKGEDTARLEADHADATFDERREHVENLHQAAPG